MTRGSTLPHSGRTLIAYSSELIPVPHTEDTSSVPRIAAGAASAGRPISRAGSWIRPPPPTTASTQPAAKAASTRATTVIRPNWARPRALRSTSVQDGAAVHDGDDPGDGLVQRDA